MEIILWRDLLDPYDQAVKELVTKFEHLKYEYEVRGQYCPIEEITGRVKSISSILAKMQKKQIPMEKLENDLEDIAGIRIICQFVEDIEKVLEMIRERTDMTVIQEKDYVNHPKKSGYRSYHVIISYPVVTMNGSKCIQAEIQIRTMGMNTWSTIEHSLQYKYKQNIPDHLKEKLQKSAEEFLSLDEVLSSVRDEIMDAQNDMRLQANLVSMILMTIQNLYGTATEVEIERIQAEFFEVYRRGDIRKLIRFHRQLDNIAESYRRQQITFNSEDVT